MDTQDNTTGASSSQSNDFLDVPTAISQISNLLGLFPNLHSSFRIPAPDHTPTNEHDAALTILDIMQNLADVFQASYGSEREERSPDNFLQTNTHPGMPKKVRAIPEDFHKIDSPQDERIADLTIIHDSDVKKKDLFFVESRLPIQRLFASKRYPIKYVAITPNNIEWIQQLISTYSPPTDEANNNNSQTTHATKPAVYVLDHETLYAVLGYKLHRGCIAVATRTPLITPSQLLRNLLAPPTEPSTLVPTLASLTSNSQPMIVLVMERFANPENVGGIFRSALALGVSAIFLSPTCCDLFYRKAIRGSMGAVTKLPFAWVPNWPQDLNLLKEAGFCVVALTPSAKAVCMSEALRDIGNKKITKVALMVGHEGDGISDQAEAQSDVCVKIEMVPKTADSLNVSSCTAVALYAVAIQLGVLTPH